MKVQLVAFAILVFLFTLSVYAQGIGLSSESSAPTFQELDEILGDTIIVGTTWWENQHSGTVGRMVTSHKNEDEEEETVTVIWTNLDHDYEVRRADIVELVLDERGRIQHRAHTSPLFANSSMGGYCVLASIQSTGRVFPFYHAWEHDLNRYYTLSAIQPVFNMFEFISNPLEDNNLECIWPNAAAGEFHGIPYVHVISTEYNNDDGALKQLVYWRGVAGGEGEEINFEAAQLVSSNGRNISGDIAVSDDGERVAIAASITRDNTDDHLAIRSYNNDIYFWLSEDGGATWNWDNPVNLTDFISPGPWDNGDTMRAYTDVNICFDNWGDLHVAFSTLCFYPGEDRADSRAMIWHWDEASDVFTLVAHSAMHSPVRAGDRQISVQRPSMYHDAENGILWLVYQQYGIPGDTLDDGVPRDQSDDGYANGDIFVTASPRGEAFGKFWSKGINITNTRGRDGNIQAYECMNERDPSIALNNDGHFLNIFYVLDRDAGFYELNEGIRTLNPAVLHRVLKYDLANHLNSQREWLPNYPLHRDSSGFWQDPYGWVWFENGPWFDVEEPDFGVVQEPSSLPVDFVVGHASPNPFNAVTSIPFSLSARSEIVFRVFNLLGQEILQQRRMYDAGNHRFHFDTSSLVSPLSSGVYLVQIGHGNESILRKVVLLK